MKTSFTVQDGYSTFLKEFSGEIQSPGKKRVASRALSLLFLGEVIPETPVDTGRARGGWTASPHYNNFNVGGSDQDEVLKGRLESDYNERQTRRGWTIEIINGVRHIVPLELGSSLQAPAGFARKTLAKLSGKFREKELRRVVAAIRLANIRARAQFGIRQGLGARGVGRAGRL